MELPLKLVLEVQLSSDLVVVDEDLLLAWWGVFLLPFVELLQAEILGNFQGWQSRLGVNFSRWFPRS